MNASQLFEAFASLPLQVLVVVIAVVLLNRFVDQAASSCRLWTIGFLSILGLIASGFLFPHLRLVQFGGGLSESPSDVA